VAAPLFVRVPLALQAAYSDLVQRASDPGELLLGTPGTVSERSEGGGRYFFRQFYDSEGTKTSEHIGSTDDPEAIRRAEEIRDRIASANALIDDARALGRAGYARCDARTEAVLVSLANAGFFRGGGILIGSHALSCILNDLGARVPPLRTEDVDVARRERLALDSHPLSFEEILLRSRVPLLPIPTLDRKVPSTSFAIPPRRQRGGGRFRIDLLAPITGEPYRPIAVPELKAHALGMPHLRYLLADPLATVVLGRSAMIPVNVPRPERFAWHKLLVSQLRSSIDNKRSKDETQAATLIAALTQDAPEQLVAAFEAVSRSSKKKMRPAMDAVAKILDRAGHANASALVRDVR
jgi:hypothetical protein